MVAARLIEVGELALSDTIGTFFASSGNFPNVSVLQLLTHTGGFISEERLWDKVKDPQETIQYILHSQPQCVPGEKVIYSCFGFIILGAILETIFGNSLALAAKELVFQPLGMDQTTYCPHQAAKTFPSGFASTEIDACSGTMLSGIVHDENARFMHGVSGNSGCFSCMEDLVIWAQMLLSEGKSMHGNQFLSKTIVDVFSQNLTEGLGDARSLGFKILPLGKRGPNGKETLAYGHTGFTGTSVLLVPARNVAVILLTNRVHPSRIEQRLLSLRPTFHEYAMDLVDCYQL
jgi:CubicO group peptidase (beta-lactamase class C family)